MSNETPTPRTDAEHEAYIGMPWYDRAPLSVIPKNFARKLECELEAEKHCNAALVHALKWILREIEATNNKDWFDPDCEKFARMAIAEAKEAQQ